MRVTHHRDERRIRNRHGPEQSLEPPGGSGEEEIAMKCFSHEIGPRLSVTESSEWRKTRGGASGFAGDVPADGYAGENCAHSGEGIGEWSGARRRRGVLDAHDARGNFAGARPIAPGNFGEDGVARRINVRGFEAGSG